MFGKRWHRRAMCSVVPEQRLPGKLADVPTAVEQGFDIKWPIARGFYVGPNVGDADYKRWGDAFATTMKLPEYAKLLQERNLFPLPMTADEITAFVNKQVAAYKTLAADFGLTTK